MKRPKIPEYIGDAGRAWLRRVYSSDNVSISLHDMDALWAAASCLDRIEQARDAITEHGIICRTADDSLKPNPACAIERDQKTLFARLSREIGLFVTAPDIRIPKKRGSR
jgi:P27 family predicted phage terminase small subunit